MNNENNDAYITNFLLEEPKHRMSATAELFKIRNNPELCKKKYPSGFKHLDSALSGGFAPGLHCLGAVSSLGKSTLALQIASNIAALGTPVVLFSLEMRREDIVAKTLSRLISLDNPVSAPTSEMLLTYNGISDEQFAAVQKLLSEPFFARITIEECGCEPCDVERIRTFLSAYIGQYRIRPFVIIDYLQILDTARQCRGTSDKQATDHNIRQLKRISDTYRLPILLISSFNRDSYDTEVSLKSFKESGSIEYSCDTLLGLQLRGTGSAGFDANAAKAMEPRKIELKILKQRYGETGTTICFDFYAKYNRFDETVGTSRPKTTPPPANSYRF